MSNWYEMYLKMKSPQISSVIYTEFGYEIIGEIPNDIQLKEIEKASKEYIDNCKKSKEEQKKILAEYYADLWDINHPIQVLFNKLIKYFKKL